MLWQSLESWVLGTYRKHEWSMDGIGSTGVHDVAAVINPLGRGKWKIEWWPDSNTGDKRQELDFDGTLEEAQAVAYLMVRL